MPAACIVTAGVSLPVFFTGLLLVYVFYFLLGWSPAPVGRLDAFASAPPTVTGFYLIDAALIGDWETWRSALRAAGAAGSDARPLRPGADRPHHPRLDAGGAGGGVHPHRAGLRPVRRTR